MVKTCAWGTCNSDTRYSDRVENVYFIPFPKPKTNFDKCLRWVKACGRPRSQLNTSKIDRHKFVCSKHFVGGKGPTEDFPDPLPADGSDIKKSRSHWRQRQQSSRKQEPGFAIKTQPSPQLSSATANKSPICTDQTIPCRCSSLALLSAAAEIQKLQQQVQIQNEQLHQQGVLIQHLQVQNTSGDTPDQNISAQSYPLTVANILKQDDKIKGLFEHYSSLKYSTFITLLKFLSSEHLPKFEKNRKEIETMGLDEQLLLTLMRLRHNFGVIDLASRFCISQQSVSDIFLVWLDHMYLMLGAIPIWPHRDDIIDSMPSQFKLEFPSTLVIIDCTELKTQKPSSMKLQSQMYSDYKSNTTLKGLVACDPMGNIIFVSELFTGSMSDKEITEKSGFYKLLQQLVDAGYVKQGDSVMADKGFTISDELEKMGLRLNIPPFVSAGCQLSQANVILTQKIARHRIHVERAIRRIRTYKIISNCVPTSIFASVNKLWTVCSLLTLWQNPVLKK